MRVLGISGSLRRDSYNSGLLRTAAGLLPSGAELELFDGLKAIPPYDADDDVESGPEAVRALRDALADADAVLVATPEYNASIPGVLKNALDWASRPHATNPLRGKPVAVVGASTGMFGAVWAQAEARKVLSTIGARVIDRELPVAEADERFDAGGRLTDAEIEEQLAEIVAELVGAAEARAAGLAARAA
jgi:chromate reductase